MEIKKNLNHAKILSQKNGEITFQVDEVEPAVDRLKTESRASRIGHRLGLGVTMVSEATSDVVREPVSLSEPSGIHPFVSCIHQAFAEHRPLELRPDDFALLLAQGLSQHINLHAEELREKLVSHKGKITVIVETTWLTTEDEWAIAIETLSKRIREDLNPELHRGFGNDFTTTTPAMRIAGEIALLKAFERYYDYILICICGIPQITLTGTAEDWKKLRQRIDLLNEFGLGWWASRLEPIFEQLVASAEGRPDRNFWQAICKPREAYRTAAITGWMTDLFPYISGRVGSAEPAIQNPMLETKRIDWILQQNSDNRMHPNGIAPSRFPKGLSEVSFELILPDSKQEMKFVGGFLAVEQVSSGSIRTAIGWAIAKCSILPMLLDRIEAEHESQLPEDPLTIGFPEFMVAFTERFSTATLFPRSENPWTIRRCRDAIVPGLEIWNTAAIVAYRPNGEVLASRFWSDSEDENPKYVVIHGRLEQFELEVLDLPEFPAPNDLPILQDVEVLRSDMTTVVESLLNQMPLV